jgi:short subunit dehydrogenase-like uncharacterized protein
MSNPKYSVIVFGATSFVGQILCRYLLDTFGKDGNGKLKWAAAGRSESKLQALRAELGPKAAKLALIVADSFDEAALESMCAQTRVVVSTVGPYALFGEPLVKVCAESGTDYCDLTGEVQWIRRMVTAYESAAQQSGARIVHCCGFDSIPSDLGVFFLQQEANKRYGAPCTTVKMRVKAIAGAASGGTVASLMNVVKEASKDAALRRELADPYSVCPPGHGFTKRQNDLKTAQYDPDFKAWITPFVMAGINTRIVHRSNALSNNAYGADFCYDEASLTKPGVKGWLMAQGVAVGTAGFLLAVALPPTRWAIERFVVPKPGEGPSPAAQEKGFYDLRFFGKTAKGQTLRVKVTGDRDPGYGSTAKMLGQAAACLALDIGKDDCEGGFWTPATIFGERLIKRLRANSGLAFEVLEG